MQENQLLDAPRITVEQLLQHRPANSPALVSVAAAAAVSAGGTHGTPQSARPQAHERSIQ